MSTTAAGRRAEEAVVNWLRTTSGHTILDRNWRTRWCEIDVISRKGDTVYFTEVKFRSSQNWGTGLEYITQKKLRQMTFAAEFWIAERKWALNAQLCAAEVNQDYEINFVDV